MLFICLLLFSSLSIAHTQQMKTIQSNVQSVHQIFAEISDKAYALLPYRQGAQKTSTYSFDGTDGRTGLSLSISYNYKINGVSFSNVLSYSPNEADYYLTYIKGLQFFENTGGVSYRVGTIKSNPKMYLWQTKDKTAVLVPEAPNKKSYGFFLKIHFPKDATNEAILVEDIASKINWTALQKLFAT
ncbi:MAG: hypothetical protein ACRCY4_07315 [Brevinema sp.]